VGAVANIHSRPDAEMGAVAVHRALIWRQVVAAVKAEVRAAMGAKHAVARWAVRVVFDEGSVTSGALGDEGAANIGRAMNGVGSDCCCCFRGFVEVAPLGGSFDLG
jgi:hypothetical protein